MQPVSSVTGLFFIVVCLFVPFHMCGGFLSTGFAEDSSQGPGSYLEFCCGNHSPNWVLPLVLSASIGEGSLVSEQLSRFLTLLPAVQGRDFHTGAAPDPPSIRVFEE
jgi:hypothetical protein